jgi:hypothetical protein
MPIIDIIEWAIHSRKVVYPPTKRRRGKYEGISACTMQARKMVRIFLDDCTITITEPIKIIEWMCNE